jgi:ArsR family transcriptional regulator
MKKIVQICKAFGDETRLKILITITKRGICAKGLAKHLGLSEATVSQHLKILREAGIIVGEKKGYYVLYHIRQSTLQALTDFFQRVREGTLETESLGISIPTQCRANCKASYGKCCQKKY